MFFCVALSHVIQYLTEDGLTWFPLRNLFGRQRKGGEQLHKNLDNHLIQGVCRFDLGIDVEAIQKVFDRLKQINQCIIAANDARERLMQLDVTTMHT